MDTQIDKAVWNGGGCKAASKKQISLMEELAHGKGIDLKFMTQNSYRLHHRELSGAQANATIRSILK